MAVEKLLTVGNHLGTALGIVIGAGGGVITRDHVRAVQGVVETGPARIGSV